MRTAVVVGAGVGGLAVAGRLGRDGWRVTVLERAARLCTDGTAVLVWPEGVRALEQLGLAAELRALSQPMCHAGIRRPDGQWLVRPEPAGDEPARACLLAHRADLHDMLVAALAPDTEVRTGVAVRAVRTATVGQPAVTDGTTTWEADLVIGADGVDSVVRRRLAPEARAQAAGLAAWRAWIPWYRAPALPDSSAEGETVGGGHRFRFVSLREGPAGTSRGGVYWSATIPGACRPEPPAAQLDLLRRWFGSWHEPIGTLLAATTAPDLVQQPVVELRPGPRTLSFAAGRGGYVLLGDAAHGMGAQLGRGACVAWEDAALLCELIGSTKPGPALRAVLAEYTRRRRPRLAQMLRQARRTGAGVTGGLPAGPGSAALRSMVALPRWSG